MAMVASTAVRLRLRREHGYHESVVPERSLMLRLRSFVRRPAMLPLIAVILVVVGTTTAWCGGIGTLLH